MYWTTLDDGSEMLVICTSEALQCFVYLEDGFQVVPIFTLKTKQLSVDYLFGIRDGRLVCFVSRELKSIRIFKLSTVIIPIPKNKIFQNNDENSQSDHKPSNNESQEILKEDLGLTGENPIPFLAKVDDEARDPQHFLQIHNPSKLQNFSRRSSIISAQETVSEEIEQNLLENNEEKGKLNTTGNLVIETGVQSVDNAGPEADQEKQKLLSSSNRCSTSTDTGGYTTPLIIALVPICLFSTPHIPSELTYPAVTHLSHSVQKRNSSSSSPRINLAMGVEKGKDCFHEELLLQEEKNNSHLIGWVSNDFCCLRRLPILDNVPSKNLLTSLQIHAALTNTNLAVLSKIFPPVFVPPGADIMLRSSSSSSSSASANFRSQSSHLRCALSLCRKSVLVIHNTPQKRLAGFLISPPPLKAVAQSPMVELLWPGVKPIIVGGPESKEDQLSQEGADGFNFSLTLNSNMQKTLVNSPPTNNNKLVDDNENDDNLYDASWEFVSDNLVIDKKRGRILRIEIEATAMASVILSKPELLARGALQWLPDCPSDQIPSYQKLLKNNLKVEEGLHFHSDGLSTTVNNAVPFTPERTHFQNETEEDKTQEYAFEAPDFTLNQQKFPNDSEVPRVRRRAQNMPIEKENRSPPSTFSEFIREERTRFHDEVVDRLGMSVSEINVSCRLQFRKLCELFKAYIHSELKTIREAEKKLSAALLANENFYILMRESMSSIGSNDSLIANSHAPFSLQSLFLLRSSLAEIQNDSRRRIRRVVHFLLVIAPTLIFEHDWSSNEDFSSLLMGVKDSTLPSQSLPNWLSSSTLKAQSEKALSSYGPTAADSSLGSLSPAFISLCHFYPTFVASNVTCLIETLFPEILTTRDALIVHDSLRKMPLLHLKLSPYSLNSFNMDQEIRNSRDIISMSDLAQQLNKKHEYYNNKLIKHDGHSTSSHLNSALSWRSKIYPNFAIDIMQDCMIIMRRASHVTSILQKQLIPLYPSEETSIPRLRTAASWFQSLVVPSVANTAAALLVSANQFALLEHALLATIPSPASLSGFRPPATGSKPIASPPLPQPHDGSLSIANLAGWLWLKESGEPIGSGGESQVVLRDFAPILSFESHACVTYIAQLALDIGNISLRHLCLSKLSLFYPIFRSFISYIIFNNR